MNSPYTEETYYYQQNAHAGGSSRRTCPPTAAPSHQYESTQCINQAATGTLLAQHGISFKDCAKRCATHHRCSVFGMYHEQCVLFEDGPLATTPGVTVYRRGKDSCGSGADPSLHRLYRRVDGGALAETLGELSELTDAECGAVCRADSECGAFVMDADQVCSLKRAQDSYIVNTRQAAESFIDHRSAVEEISVPRRCVQKCGEDLDCLHSCADPPPPGPEHFVIYPQATVTNSSAVGRLNRADATTCGQACAASPHCGAFELERCDGTHCRCSLLDKQHMYTVEDSEGQDSYFLAGTEVREYDPDRPTEGCDVLGVIPA